MIEINNLKKSYKNAKNETPFSVDNINIKAEKGKIIGILGPNGSGKSTILKSICGFHFPDEGNIKLTQNDTSLCLTSSCIPENVMNFIGYVPEISTLPPDMSVQEFLLYVCALHQINQIDLKKYVKMCSLEKVLSKKIKTLSKGFQQRVSLAQALLYNPENLILDEIISGLDPAQIVQTRQLIKKLSCEKAIIMSTHILQEVTVLCDYVYVIYNGKITAQGTEKDIIEQCKTSTFEEAFIKLTSGTENE
ncbi:MAG: ABC transporter ATP-binding protein [Treponema sp.]|nr:ABC transporter ATP-binding protein [Treponema sp.]